MTEDVLVRRADVTDAAALARLKLTWSPPEPAVARRERASFAARLAAWMERMDDRVICCVAEADGNIVGMAWLVVFDRVPDPDDDHRVSGDVQSVYVAPGFRGRGVGARLVTAVCEEADRRGVPRVLVHSSSRAIPLYRRLGFAPLDRLMARMRATE